MVKSEVGRINNFQDPSAPSYSDTSKAMPGNLNCIAPSANQNKDFKKSTRWSPTCVTTMIRQSSICAANATRHVFSKAERIRHIKTCNLSKSSGTRRVYSPSTPNQSHVRYAKKFKCKKNLSQHMRIHKPARYQCEKCSKRYKWLSGYRRHQTCCK